MHDLPTFLTGPARAHLDSRLDALQYLADNVSGANLAEGPTDWRPAQPELTVFMEDRLPCRVCRLMKCAGEGKHGRLLHVRRSDDLLTVTDADDLCHPGWYFHARLAVNQPRQSIFKLQDDPPGQRRSRLFRAGTGVVLLSSNGGRLHMEVSGEVAGLCRFRDCVIDGWELKSGGTGIA